MSLKSSLLQSVTAIALVLSVPSMAQADQQLKNVLQDVFENNPEIEAARYEYQSVMVDEDLARTGYKPNVALSTAVGVKETTIGGSDGIHTKPRQYSLSATQPIYRGGQTMANISQAKNAILAQTAFLSATQQSILLESATAYVDVLTTRHIYDLNKQNEGRLAKQLEAEQEKFRVGQSTKTDVSQAEARLARAKADRIAAHADVKAAEASYVRIVGQPFSDKDKSHKGVLPAWSLPVPTSVDEAVQIAKDNSPELIATEFIAEAQSDTVRSTWGQLLPQVDLVASTSRQRGQSPFANDVEEEQVLLQMNVPLYQSGSVRAQTKQAEKTEQQRRVEIHIARREMEDNIAELWQRYNSSLSEVDAIKVQVKAADIALNGTREEARVGARTTLDILDAEQELLDAQVSLTQAERDSMVLQWQLLRQMGWFTPEILEFEVANAESE